MSSMRKPVVVVESADMHEFERECLQLFEDGYRLDSSSCGFVNSEEYDFCQSYQAIFVDKQPPADKERNRNYLVLLKESVERLQRLSRETSSGSLHSTISRCLTNTQVVIQAMERQS